MERFDELFATATAGIGQEYFQLPLHDGSPVPRERVYCYELYHQLRAGWPKDSPFRLNGEVDKRNHPYFGPEQPKPDFIIHQPGTGENFITIEVKAAGAAPREILKDLRSLELMGHRARYQRLIYFIYGAEAQRTLERVLAIVQDFSPTMPVEIWLQTVVGRPASLAATVGLKR